MNPPYSGNLHLKILSYIISLCPDAEIVNLSPANQMFSGVRLIKDHSEIKKNPELVQHIQDVDLIKPEEASAMFGASFAGPLMLKFRHIYERHNAYICLLRHHRLSLTLFYSLYFYKD